MRATHLPPAVPFELLLLLWAPSPRPHPRPSAPFETSSPRSTHTKELEALTQKAATVDETLIRCRDLESALAQARSELRAAQEEGATLQRQQRAAREEVEEARREAERTSRELGSATDYMAGILSDLAVSGVEEGAVGVTH